MSTAEFGIDAGKPSRRLAAESESLADRAYRRIEEMIVTLELEPGQVLSEALLGDELGFGRTPIREALQRLATEGLVTVLPRRGVLVSEINPSRQLLVLELRRELERLTARKAAARRSRAERETFIELADALAEAARNRDEAAFVSLDRQFHRAMNSASRNEFAERAMRQIQGLSRRFWFQHFREILDLERCARLHEGVARAVAEGDEEAAAKASDSLIDYIVEFTRSTV